MASGQRGFDALLLGEEPIERVVEFLLVDLAERQRGGRCPRVTPCSQQTPPSPATNFPQLHKKRCRRAYDYTRAARLTRIAKSRLSLGELAADAGEPIRALPGGQFPVE
jgi:hypothetical protein